MVGSDPATELTRRLSAILEDCKRIKKPLESYLKATDDRPDIHFEILRILSNALAAYELIVPAKEAGEFHGIPHESMKENEKFTIRHTERPEDWDFRPWLSEKLNRIQEAAKNMVKYWLMDPGTIKLSENSPVSPKEWVRDGALFGFREVEILALKVFQEVCMDTVEIKPSVTEEG